MSTQQKERFVSALCEEIQMKAPSFSDKCIQTISFGGGTPSLLSISELENILNTIQQYYTLSPHLELSIECNPENISHEFLIGLKRLQFNRISIGVQSFFDEDLLLMNRNHDAHQSVQAIQLTSHLFENVSIDLMFGLPHAGMERWKKNLEQAEALAVPHISTYNLTVEEKTALERKIKRKELPLEKDTTLNDMYFYTLDFLEKKGYIPYEISNFGKENFWSLHNIAYWKNEPYIGFGPSAHSYDGRQRTWNISNLNNYIRAIETQAPYQESETLTIENKYNEYILTRLRTIFGISISEIKANFGKIFEKHIESEIDAFIQKKQIMMRNNTFVLTNEGKVLADFISSSLMV